MSEQQLLDVSRTLNETNRQIREWTESTDTAELLAKELQKIKDEKGEKDAADRLREVKLLAKEIDNARKDASEPFRKVTTTINGLCRPLLDRLATIEKGWKKRIKAWLDEKERRAKQEAARIAAEAKKKEEEAAQAREEGDDITAAQLEEQAEDKQAEARAVEVLPSKTTAPSFGRASSSFKWVWEVVDKNALPPEALTVNEKFLNAMAKVEPRPPAIPGVQWKRERQIASRGGR